MFYQENSMGYAFDIAGLLLKWHTQKTTLQIKGLYIIMIQGAHFPI